MKTEKGYWSVYACFYGMPMEHFWSYGTYEEARCGMWAAMEKGMEAEIRYIEESGR